MFYSECLNKEKHPKRNLKRKHPKRAEKVNIQRWIKMNLTGSFKTQSNNHNPPLVVLARGRVVRGPWVGARCGNGLFPLINLPNFYLSFTILVSLILVKYPDRIGPVNTVPWYLRYGTSTEVYSTTQYPSDPPRPPGRARHRPAPESGALQSDGTRRSAQVAAPRARAVGKGAGTSPWEDVGGAA